MTDFTRRDFISSLLALGAAGELTNLHAAAAKAGAGRTNVLFIPVDDLRPQLGCYGHTLMISPNIDRLAGEGVIFERAFCSVPVCGASRASLLSGIRPLRDRFVYFDARVDKDAPDAVTIPQLFRRNGYTTVSLGKVYHHLDDDMPGWSEQPWHAPNGSGYLLEENVRLHESNSKKTPPRSGPAWEGADVDDEAYPDGVMTSRAIAELKKFARSGEPFFLATGYLRPHLPFNSPKKYWDLYDPIQLNLAPNPFRPKGAPAAAMHNFGELRKYAWIPEAGPLPDGMALEMIHGYYASVSYVDAQIGRLLAALKELGLDKNTVVILWGDHGWQLGEHGLWCKHCNFQTSLRAPLLVKVPGISGGKRTSALTEFVDIYPTLCELCGLEPPPSLQGTSFVPLLNNSEKKWKKAVFSCFHNGGSVRTNRYLYTEWTDKNGRVYARMLYDHQSDPGENVNISELPENREVVKQLSELLHAGWRSQIPG